MRWGLLLLAGCGAAGVSQGLLEPMPHYTHAAQLVADFGEPCSKDGAEGGLQVWRYCAGVCPGLSEPCVVACSQGCIAWQFHIAGGIIINTIGPEQGAPP